MGLPPERNHGDTLFLTAEGNGRCTGTDLRLSIGLPPLKPRPEAICLKFRLLRRLPISPFDIGQQRRGLHAPTFPLGTEQIGHVFGPIEQRGQPC